MKTLLIIGGVVVGTGLVVRTLMKNRLERHKDDLESLLGAAIFSGNSINKEYALGVSRNFLDRAEEEVRKELKANVPGATLYPWTTLSELSPTFRMMYGEGFTKEWLTRMKAPFDSSLSLGSYVTIDRLLEQDPIGAYHKMKDLGGILLGSRGPLFERVVDRLSKIARQEIMDNLSNIPVHYATRLSRYSPTLEAAYGSI